MISHESCRDDLGEFLDQTLDSNRRAGVASHLEGCAECARIARELSAIRDTLRATEPRPAPPELRRNVRAAIEAEQQARRGFSLSGRNWPRFAMPRFKMSPLAWSGTLALGAFTLMILAQPFANAPEMVSETSPRFEAAPTAPQTVPTLKMVPKSESKPPRNDAARLNQAKSGVSPSRPAPRTAAKSGAAETKTPASAGQNKSSNPPEQPPLSLARPLPSPKVELRRPKVETRPDSADAAAPRALPDPPTRSRARNAESPRDSVVAPSVVPAPAARVAPPAPVVSRLAPPDTAPRARAGKLSQNATRGDFNRRSDANGIAGENSRATAPAPQRRGELPQNLESEAPRAAAGAPTADSSPATFVFSLRAAPVNGTSMNAAASGRADATRPRLDAREERASRPGPANGATKATTAREPEAAGAPTSPNPLPAPLENRALQVPQPRLAAPARDNAFRYNAARDTAPPPDARGFELQIQAPRRVANAQIRLEIPPEARLLSLGPGIVWSGELRPETPLQIVFSLANLRGGEKISVVLEQKMADAPSRILQKQILIVP